MINALLMDPSTGTVEAGDISLLETWQGSDRLIWLDLHQAGSNEEQDLFERLDIHPIAVADATRKRHPPKMERFGHFDFILMRGLDASFSGQGLEFKAIQLAMFVGENWIITRH